MTPNLAIFGLGTMEVIFILLAIVLLFGATKLPKLARSMGLSVGEFKKGLKEGNENSASPPSSPSSGAADEEK